MAGSVPEHTELVIFDCDGVLVDSERIANEVLAEVLGGHGMPLSWQEAKAAFLGQSVADIRANAALRSESRCLRIGRTPITRA